MAPAVLTEGTRLGNYEIAEQLGVGAMGTVYRARDARLRRHVALKIMRPELASDSRFAQRFLVEARLAAAIDHPHVVTVFEAGESDGHLFLAMRLVDGPDLRAIIHHSGPLSPTRAAHVCDQVAGALDAAHAAGLVHRDVKPANVLLGAHRRADHAFLADFGVARSVDATAGTATRNGVVGTLAYMAPEVIDGASPGPAADLYALACTSFHAMAGRPPFDYPTEPALLWAHVNENPPRLSAYADVPTDVDDVLAWAMSKDPADRPGTAELFSTALLGALEPGDVTVSRPRPARAGVAAPTGATVTVTQAGTTETVVVGRPSRARVAAASAVVVGALAGALGAQAITADDPPQSETVASSVLSLTGSTWHRAPAGSGQLAGLDLTGRISVTGGDGVAATMGRYALDGDADFEEPFASATLDALAPSDGPREARIAGRVGLVLSGRTVDGSGAVVLRATDRGLVGFSCTAASRTAAVAACLDLAESGSLVRANAIDLGAEPAVSHNLRTALAPLQESLDDRQPELASRSVQTRTEALEAVAGHASRAAAALRPALAAPAARPALTDLDQALRALGQTARRAAKSQDGTASQLREIADDVEDALRRTRDALRALEGFGYRPGN